MRTSYLKTNYHVLSSVFTWKWVVPFIRLSVLTLACQHRVFTKKHNTQKPISDDFREELHFPLLFYIDFPLTPTNIPGEEWTAAVSFSKGNTQSFTPFSFPFDWAVSFMMVRDFKTTCSVCPVNKNTWHRDQCMRAPSGAQWKLEKQREVKSLHWPADAAETVIYQSLILAQFKGIIRYLQTI